MIKNLYKNYLYLDEEYQYDCEYKTDYLVYAELLAEEKVKQIYTDVTTDISHTHKDITTDKITLSTSKITVDGTDFYPFIDSLISDQLLFLNPEHYNNGNKNCQICVEDGVNLYKTTQISTNYYKILYNLDV